MMSNQRVCGLATSDGLAVRTALAFAKTEGVGYGVCLFIQ